MSETFGESENRSVAESACMRARFGLTCTGRAWCAGKECGMFLSSSSMERFQSGGRSRSRVPTAEAVCGFSVRRWKTARRQACSSASSLVGASAETRSWMSSSFLKLLGNFKTHCQEALAKPGGVYVLPSGTRRLFSVFCQDTK